MPATILLQFEHPFVDSSMLRLPTVPPDVQVIVFVSPMFHISVPLGEVTVMLGGCGAVDSVKLEFDVSDGLPDVA